MHLSAVRLLRCRKECLAFVRQVAHRHAQKKILYHPADSAAVSEDGQKVSAADIEFMRIEDSLFRQAENAGKQLVPPAFFASAICTEKSVWLAVVKVVVLTISRPSSAAFAAKLL